MTERERKVAELKAMNAQIVEQAMKPKPATQPAIPATLSDEDGIQRVPVGEE